MHHESHSAGTCAPIIVLVRGVSPSLHITLYNLGHLSMPGYLNRSVARKPARAVQTESVGIGMDSQSYISKGI